MWFETAAAGANPTARLKIDNAGRVTMPSQIGFSYLGSKSYVISGTGTTAMSSSNVWASNVNHAHNRGSHFNASTVGLPVHCWEDINSTLDAKHQILVLVISGFT